MSRDYTRASVYSIITTVLRYRNTHVQMRRAEPSADHRINRSRAAVSVFVRYVCTQVRLHLRSSTRVAHVRVLSCLCVRRDESRYTTVRVRIRFALPFRARTPVLAECTAGQTKRTE